MNVLTLIFSIFLCYSSIECSNILALFPAPSKSHSILGVQLTKGLLKRGHHVTLVSAHNLMEPADNFTYIELKNVLKYRDELWNKQKDRKITRFMIFQMFTFFNDLSEITFEEEGMKKMMQDKPKYDVVILSSFFSDCFMGIAHHFEVPLILFSPVGSSSNINKYIANPTMVYVENPFLSSSTDTFIQRLTTVAFNIILEVFTDIFMTPPQNELLKKYIPNSPPIEELRKNVSLVLVNSHYSIESPRPYVPNMVQIGGYHIQDTNELPKDIKKFLDEAKNGAILFSMGSNVLISMFEETKRDAIFKVLGEMAPMKVLFKSELEHKNTPKNIMIKKWLPQSDVLAHPNIKVFISHGGLGGNTEAVYHGVPILGIPFFGDQKMNLEKAQEAGYAAILHQEDLTEELFREKLRQVIEDPKYAINAKKRSALMKEQPVKPMDNAAFWIEHIIKYGGGSHLRNAGMDLSWYQLYMVDIYIFCTLLLCVAIVINYYIVKFSIRIVKKMFVKEKPKEKTS